jgi:hypothetical protein
VIGTNGKKEGEKDTATYACTGNDEEKETMNVLKHRNLEWKISTEDNVRFQPVRQAQGPEPVAGLPPE